MTSLSSAQSIRAKVISQWPTSVVGSAPIILTLTNGVYTVSFDATGIPVGSVTFAMMQDIPTDSLIGRDTAGTGAPESITLDDTLEFSGSQTIQRAALTGDVTAAAGSNATTIAANAVTTAKINDLAVTTAKIAASNVTFAKIQDISTARILGRVTASSGVVEELTGTQATTLIDAFVGDSGSGGTKGAVPAPGAGDAAAGKYLDSDGTWTVPPSSGGSVDQSISQGRLTLTTAVPVTTSDVTAAGTIYFTPFGGNGIALYDGSSTWSLETFAELSIALSGGTASKPHDVFVDYNGGAPQLNLTAWTDATTRATALALQDGIYVKSGATDHRYVGSIYIDASNQCEDSLTSRHVWNMYNRKTRPLYRHDSTASWNYTTAAFRQVNASSLNQFSIIHGLSEESVEIEVLAIASNGTSFVQFATGIGLDSSIAIATNSTAPLGHSTANTNMSMTANFSGFIGVGLHELRWLEYSQATGTTTWQGNASAPTRVRAGMTGHCMA